jgi:hypothetical protein
MLIHMRGEDENPKTSFECLFSMIHSPAFLPKLNPAFLGAVMGAGADFLKTAVLAGGAIPLLPLAGASSSSG